MIYFLFVIIIYHHIMKKERQLHLGNKQRRSSLNSELNLPTVMRFPASSTKYHPFPYSVWQYHTCTRVLVDFFDPLLVIPYQLMWGWQKWE